MELTLDVSRLNEILGDLESFRRLRKREKVNGDSIEVIKTIDDIHQGEYGQSFEIYFIKDLDIWIRLEIRTDSYGECDYIHGISFVKPIEKIITRFEIL